MSYLRYARKTDTTQAEVISTLNQVGVATWIIGRPVDLLVRFWCPKHQTHCFDVLEVKTPVGKRKPRVKVDPRQVEQNDFIEQTGCPRVASGTEALLALSLRHGIVSAHDRPPTQQSSGS